MLSKYLSPDPLWKNNGLAIIRIITGLLMAWHGQEIFDSDKMDAYLNWEVIKALPAPVLMVYAGKGIELVAGVFITLGFLTRLAALFMAINMLFICFVVANGKFYYEGLRPFLFAMLAMVFFFSGPVKWSIDQLIHKPRNTYHSY